MNGAVAVFILRRKRISAAAATASGTRNRQSSSVVPGSPKAVMPSIAVSISTAKKAIPIRSGRLVGRVVPQGIRIHASTTTTIPAGTFTRNMPRQAPWLTNRPPMTGPIAPPIGKIDVNIPIARSRFLPKWSATMPVAEGTIAPPPIAATRERHEHVDAGRETATQ